jgi:hypothetical protein
MAAGADELASVRGIGVDTASAIRWAVDEAGVSYGPEADEPFAI